MMHSLGKSPDNDQQQTLAITERDEHSRVGIGSDAEVDAPMGAETFNELK